MGIPPPSLLKGEFLAGVLIFLGIGLIGFASARLTSKWLNVDDGVTVLGAKVSSLEREIVSLRDVLLAQRLPNELSPAPEERFSTLAIGGGSDRPHR